jgi:hypothetical protein
VPPITHPVQLATHESEATSQIALAPQVPAPILQRFATSSHASRPSHATPSSQWLPGGAVHAPAWHESPVVQKSPSSQAAPSRLLQSVALVARVQTRHGFKGLIWPLP